MKLKYKALAIGSALAMAMSATAANAALFVGSGFWGTGTTTTAYSKSNKAFSFSFELPDTLGSDFTSSITNFSYTLGNSTVAATPTGIQFYNLDDGGMFDIQFSDHSVSLYGPDFASDGTFPTSGYYFFGAGIDGGNATGNGGFGFEIAAVPETGTWVMMMLGFGAIGAAMRTQRRQKVNVNVAYA